MHVVHINLAKGFRGGERQTLLLVKGLAKQYPCINQTLVVRYGSPLEEYANRIHKVRIITIKRPFIFYLIKIPNCDLIHAHEAKACHLAHWLSRRIKKPYIITRRMDRAPGKSCLTEKAYRHCAHLVCLSSAIADIMSARFPGLSLSIIPSMKASLPYSEENVSNIRNAYANKILIGNIGALVKKHKGQQYIIEAAKLLEKSHPKLHFLLVGDGEDAEDLNKQSRNLSNLSFTGFVKNIGDYLHAFDLFLFPSLQEGLGSTLLDAMEAHKPIIASSVGGIPDIIRNEENGLLVPPASAQAIINAIDRLLEDKALAERLARQSLKDSEKYTPKKISVCHKKIYDHIIESSTTNNTNTAPKTID